MGLLGESFVWITTDGITARPEVLAYQQSYPSFYYGLIGILPYYGRDTVLYNRLADTYIEYGGFKSDVRMSSVKVAMGLGYTHKALKQLDEGTWDNSPRLSCNSDKKWQGGQVLYEQIHNNVRSGSVLRIGNIKINTSKRNGMGIGNPSYDIMNFQENGFVKVGQWTNDTGLTDVQNNDIVWNERKDILFLGDQKTPPTGFGQSLTGYHLRIGLVPEAPIVFLKPECENLTSQASPDCWYGWNPDIIKKLQEDLNFTYEYVRSEGDKYGGFDSETKTWNGMVGDLLARKIDLATALSINTERTKYVDYTSSIYEDQASMISYTPASSSSTNLFFFLEPFEITVWLSIIGLIIVVAFLTTFLSKFSPFGAYGRKMHAMQVCPCEQCVGKRELKKETKCRLVDTNTYECMVDKVEEEDDFNELSYYNAVWLVGTGEILTL